MPEEYTFNNYNENNLLSKIYMMRSTHDAKG